MTTTAAVTGPGSRRDAGAAMAAMVAPNSAPAAVDAAVYQSAVVIHRLPRARSPSGWMLESIDSPQGDQVERTAATRATAIPHHAVALTPGRRPRSWADTAGDRPAAHPPPGGPGRCGPPARRRPWPCS